MADEKNPVTPEKKAPADGEETSPETSGSAGSLNSQGKPKSKYKGKGLDSKGRPRNFYNPPGKVLKHLAQQSYYDNFYGNQGQFYTLKQKYKTQMCKHFLEGGFCPLQQYCQFAHGPSELRQPNDVSITFTIFNLIVIIATPKELRKDSSRRSSLQLQDHALQELLQQWRMQVR